MKKRFGEEQIVGILREAEAGVAIKELCRKHGFSKASYYAWRSKYGGMEVSDVKRLKSLEAENARLKRPLAESLLENVVTRKALQKNGNCMGPSGHGPVDADEGIVATPGARGGSHECDGAALSTTTRSQYGVRTSIVELARRHRRYGVGMIYLKLRQRGQCMNYKRIERL